MKTHDGLEYVFSTGHELHEVIFYDPSVGQYYNRSTDLYLTLEETKAFGMP